jgi:molecular chaperone GrpE
MDPDPRRFGPTHPAAEEAAEGTAESAPTDGVHSAAAADDVPVAAPDADGASGPAAEGAGAAGVKQAADDAAEPGAEAPPADAAPAQPDYRDQYLRAMAELDNVRKRARRDVSQAEARGIAKLARELLPAIDNFARALDAAEAQPENRDHHLTDGIRLVQNELLSALARVGIEQDSPKGEPFDPHCHEAIAQQPVEGAASGTIVEVYSQGYRYRDDVLRPAKVVVAA